MNEDRAHELLSDALAEIDDAGSTVRTLLLEVGCLFGDCPLRSSLEHASLQIAGATQKIREARGLSADAQFKASEQSSRNVLNAALAGIKVARGGKER